MDPTKANSDVCLGMPAQAAELALDLWLHAVVLHGFHGGAQLAYSNFQQTLALGLAMIQKNSQGENFHPADWHPFQLNSLVLEDCVRLAT